jgi:hypothetical protein
MCKCLYVREHWSLKQLHGDCRLLYFQIIRKTRNYIHFMETTELIQEHFSWVNTWQCVSCRFLKELNLVQLKLSRPTFKLNRIFYMYIKNTVVYATITLLPFLCPSFSQHVSAAISYHQVYFSFTWLLHCT